MYSVRKKRPKLATFNNLIITLILSVCFLLFAFSTNAAIRDTLSYQAKITDANLLAPVDANYNMEFRVYDAVSGGNLLWAETWNGGNQVALEDGVFTVELNSICSSWTGACASNGGVDWSSDSLFLEFGFDADGNGSFEETFAPRKRFTSVPYAQMAARLTTAEDINFSDNADHSLQWNQATDKTLTIENDDGTAVANLSVEGQLVVGNFAVAPTALSDGAMYYNTTSNLFYVRQNGSWVSVGSGGGGGDAIWDADTDTGIQTEESADDDIIRFDIGDAGGTAYPDILKIDGTNGLIWNDVGAALDFRIEGDTDTNLFFIDGSADKIGLGLNNPNAKLEITASDGNAIRVNPYGVGIGNTAEMQFMELAANGTDYVGFKSPDSLVGSVVWTLPNVDGANGEVLSTDSSGNLSWISAGGGDAIWDADTDTGIQVEEGVDDDIIRFDLGTTASDALLLSQSAGFVWNEAGLSTLDFRLEGDTDVNLFMLDASADNIGIGESAPDSNAKLEVAGNIMMDDYLYFQNTTTDYMRFDGSDFIFTNDLLPSANATYNLGSSTARWKKAFLGGNSLHIGDDGNDSDISYDNVNNNLVFNDGAESIGIRMEGSSSENLFYLDAVDNRIGIGTNSPGALLEVNGGDIWLFDDGNDPRFVVGDTGTSGNYGYLQWDSANDYFRIEKNGVNGMKINDNYVSIGNLYPDQPLKIANGATELFRVDTTGKVGINTSVLTASFEVTSSDANAIRVNPYGVVAGNTGEMQFMELAANGSDYVGFKSPDSLAASIVWTLPNIDGGNGSMLMTDGAGGLSWGNSLKSLWDADIDTGIQVEEGADEDIIRFDLGTTSTDALLLSQSTGLVWNDAGLSTLDFRLEGDTETNLFFVDASTNRVGIRTSSPDAALDVDGSMVINDPVFGDEELHIGAEDGTSSDTAISIENGTTVFEFHVEGGTDLFRLTDETEAENYFVVSGANANVGIGEAAPDINAKLEVAGNFMLDDYVYFNNVTTDYLRHDGTTFVMSDDLLPSTDDTYDFGTTTVRWNDQYLGGTLSLGADADDYDISFDETNNMLVLNNVGDADGLRIEGDTIANLFYIDAVNDNIGVGLPDTPDHFDSRLTVRNDTTDAVMRLGGPDGIYHFGAKLRFGDGDYAYIDEYADDNLQMYAAGNIYLSNGTGQVYMPSSYNNSITGRDLYVAVDGEIGYRASSLRFKENVLDMENLDWLYDLRPVNFTYKDKTKEVYNKETGQMETVNVPVDKSKQYGLIAEETELVNISLVSYDSDGLPETVNYSHLITPLLKAVQDNKTAVDPILDRIKIADNGLEIERYNAADDTDALLIRNDGEGAGLHLVQTGNSNGLGHGAAIYISGNKNSSAGDNNGIADASDSYGMYINSEETNPNQKILGIETDAGLNSDEEAFYVRADGVTKVYGEITAPNRDEDGEFGFAMSPNLSRGRLYFQVNGKDYYINRSGTGDFSEYIKSSDQSLYEDWGTIISLQVGGSEAKAMRSATMRDKNVLGIVSEFGTRNNDNEEGTREMDPSFVNVALMGQVPAKVTNQNGTIEAGDYLTTSLVYGHAMKADIGDPIIGIALEAFYGSAASSEGMIDVLLSRNTNGNITALLKELQEKKTVTKEDVLDVIMNENLVANYLVMTKGEVMNGLKVHGELELDNQNIGEIILLAGETFVQVNFPSYFKKKPVVTVSPHLLEDHGIFFDFQYLLTNITVQSFMIRLNQPLSYDLHFNWQAFAVADYTDDFIVPETTTIAEEKVIITSLNCNLDNLAGCLTAHDCWEYSELTTWTGEVCILKESGF